MVICEICEREEAEVDSIVDGDYKRMCKRCGVLEGAIVVEKPPIRQCRIPCTGGLKYDRSFQGWQG